MAALMCRLTRLLAILGFISLLIGMILKIPGLDECLAGPAGWFRFAAACGILAIAGRTCWPAEEEVRAESST